MGLPCLGPSWKEAGQRPLARETPHRTASGTAPASPPGHPRRDLRAARKSHELQTKCAGDGTQSQTATCRPLALPPDPNARLEGAPCGALPSPPHLGPARALPGAAAGVHPRRPCWSLLRARGAGALPKHILTECLQTGCPGRAFNCTCFLYFLFFFFNIFYKKNKKILYKQYIYGFL